MEHVGRTSEGCGVWRPHDRQQRSGPLRCSQPGALGRLESGELHILAIAALLFIARDVMTGATRMRSFHFEVPIGAEAEQKVRGSNDRAGELKQHGHGSECGLLSVPMTCRATEQHE